MDAIFGPGKAHQLQDLEHLLEMQALVGAHHVQHLPEVIGFTSVHGGGQITGGVQGRLVFLTQETGRHVISVQVDDQRLIADADQAGLADALDGLLQIGLVEALPGL
jgi:hypothetical protein